VSIRTVHSRGAIDSLDPEHEKLPIEERMAPMARVLNTAA